ncbi:MAG: glycosyltransferase family 39 protein [Intrasporangium sp.]|uniref:glycosyltransferase family 39 protein n=1 Tax=Intrasporangium sp. TaxID=1925024 RepID=UPI0026478154|nr:glycosyltransferase family 39 protein [Intrasporangium sp.]MDN5796572.1 glycosyltransferase family 39 protein [Intrasporangium sp.]
MRATVATATLRAIGAVMLVGGLAMVIVPRPLYTPMNQWVIVPTCIVAVAVALLVPVPHGVRAVLASRWAGPVLALVGGGVGAVVGEVMRYPYGWDAGVVMGIARRLDAGMSLTPGNYRYLSMYPNNLPLLAIDRAAARAAGWLGLSPDALLIAGNAVGLTVTIWLAHLVVRRCAGPVAAALAALLVIVLVGLSPWLAVPYTDLFAMPFVMAAIALATLAWSLRGGRRWLSWAGAVACGAVAFVVKTTPVVLVVAAVLVIALQALPAGRRAEKGRLMRTAAVVALTVLAFMGVAAGATQSSRHQTGADLSRIDTARSAPLLWWVANGMIEIDAGTYTSYGGYSRSMIEAIRGRTRPEMTAYSREFIAARWAERGLTGMLAFYADKALWNWNDGMFGAWGEGGDSRQRPYAKTAVADVLMEVNGYHGRYYETRASIAEGIWAAVVILAGVGLLLLAPPRRDVLLLALSTLGIGVFVLVFQGRSRYLLTFAPVVIALSCVVLPWARSALTRRMLQPGRTPDLPPPSRRGPRDADIYRTGGY